MIKTRIEAIDIAKGICILMILLQHAHTYYEETNILLHYSVSFQVPLFFLLSGCFFSPKSCFRTFFVGKVNQLIIPFAFFYLIFSVLIPNFLNVIGYGGLRQTDQLGVNSLFNFIYGNTKVYSNNPVWFLLALFEVTLFFYCIRWIAHRTNFDVLFTILLSLLCGFLGVTFGNYNINVPMYIDNALTACPYFCVGYFLNYYKLISGKYSKTTLIILVPLCFLAVFIFSTGIDFLGNTFSYDNIIQSYFTGLLGSLAILMISYVIGTSKILSYYGKNTLVILCMQMPVLQPINMVVKRLGVSNSYADLLCLTVIAAIIMIGVIELFNKYIPWATGKKGLFKI